MKIVKLGRTGLDVSRLCLGCMSYGDPAWRDWVLPEAEAQPFYAAAVESGINFFDTADMYSRGVSEEILGRALKSLAVRRDEVVVATKVFFAWGDGPNQGGLSRKHIFESIDGSLKRLGMDYVDLYQIHRWDPDTPIEESLEALNDIVRAGKVRYIGASSMFAWQFHKALATSDAHGWARFVSMQNHYNLIYREEEREMLPLCVDQGVGTLPWSPLARGFLAGNRTPGGGGETTRAKSDHYAQRMYYADADFEVANRAADLAARLGLQPAQVALAWLLHKPGVTSPIIGATKLLHLQQAIDAVDVVLDAEHIAYLEEAYVPHRVLGHG